MIHLIDELKVIPGVIGACIYHSQEGLKVSNLPAIFKPERINIVGKHLMKLYSAGRMSFDDLNDIALNYDESVVVARELEKNTLIFAVCDPSFNHNLLSMSFNLLQEEFKNGNFISAPAELPGETSVLEPAVEKTSTAQSHQGINHELKGLLAELKGALAKILGPMAEFVFDEVAEEWEQSGANVSRIEDLIEKISVEIGDENKAEEYRQLIAPVLKGIK